jgi:DNA-binding FadR family transcriptional regulator
MTSGASGENIHARSRRGYGGHAEELREEIKALLLSQGLRPGDAIPSETALIEQLGVSRGSLREALKSLQSLGIVETRHGSGTFVSALSFESLVDGLLFHIALEGTDGRSLIRELTEIREVLETALVRQVAVQATPETVAHLDRLVDRMAEVVEEGGDVDDLDRTFHHDLYEHLDRKLVNGLVEAFWRVLNSVRSELTPSDQPIDVVGKHRRIVEAIGSGDADAAAAAMKDHFEDTRRWVGLQA